MQTRVRLDEALHNAARFLAQSEGAGLDGWTPLWFGNQHVADDENPVYGTARVLAAWWSAGREDDECAVRARDWLADVQNPDGGWGGDVDTTSSVE